MKPALRRAEAVLEATLAPRVGETAQAPRRLEPPAPWPNPAQASRLRITAKGEVCGNGHDQALEVALGGQTHAFDRFECTLHALAVACTPCGYKVIGHGVEAGGCAFCCAHCAGALRRSNGPTQKGR